jgi:hypothetical protein
MTHTSLTNNSKLSKTLQYTNTGVAARKLDLGSAAETKLFEIYGSTQNEPNFSLLSFEMDNYQQRNYSEHIVLIHRLRTIDCWLDEQTYFMNVQTY